MFYLRYLRAELLRRRGRTILTVLGFALGKRPRLLPYLIVVHFRLDLQAAVSILLVSL